MFSGPSGPDIYGESRVDVGARIGRMAPGRFLSGMGPQPEKGRATLMTLACRNDAIRRRQREASRKSLRRVASDRQAHIVNELAAFPAGSVAKLTEEHASAKQVHQSRDQAAKAASSGAPSATRFNGQRSEFRMNGNERNVAQISGPPNNALHLTRSAAFRRSALAGERECWAGASSESRW